MTKIQWTDETWNPMTGCSRVSEGCRNCYIERTPPFRMQNRKLGDPVQMHADRLDAPLRWKRPRRVFVNSLSDLFHEDILHNSVLSVFEQMRQCPQHTFQILTKRPTRMLEVVQWCGRWFTDLQMPWPFPNVWLGVSVEDQTTADNRIPILLQTPAAVRFISAEPLLGPIDLHAARCRYQLSTYEEDHWLDWVIIGGESGANARRCDVDWIRQLKNQCQAAKVPVFVKQLGASPISCIQTREPQDDWVRIMCQKDKKGGDPAEWPADLRVRDYPATSQGGVR